MKLPRDVSAADLEKALNRNFGYHFSRQVGSHRRLTSIKTGTQHHLTIPAHDPLKSGTLRAILGEVAEYHGLSITDVLTTLSL